MKNFYLEFKTPIVIISLLFLGLFVYTKLAGPIPFFINSITTTKTDLFSADGQGKVTAVPDSATANLGITQQALTVAEAQNKTNTQANKIIESIKSLGILEKDIKTTNYSVTPNYSSGGVEPLMIRTGGQENITGYTVTQNLQVNVKPIEKINKAVDSATKAGANLVGGINFTFSDELKRSLENKAREQAVENAKDKAQNLSKATGIRLGRVINVVESSNGFPKPMMMNAASEKADTSPSNITPGESAVTINVVIYYETY